MNNRKVALAEKSKEAALRAADAAGLLDRRPVGARLLKRAKKSIVVRVEFIDGSTFIAKRGRRGSARLEHLVYEELLPDLAVPSLRLLGTLEADEGWTWLFLEDGGDRCWSADTPAHRHALGVHLGDIATATATRALPSWLPMAGVDYYRSVMDDARAMLGERGSGRPIVSEVIAELDRTELVWDRVTSVALSSPVVLCHSDTRSENIRLRTTDDPTPVLLHWELAARGPATIDLGCRRSVDEDDPFITGYYAAAREFSASTAAVVERARSGRIWRLLHSVCWAAKELDGASEDRGIAYLESYVRHLRVALDDLGLRS